MSEHKKIFKSAGTVSMFTLLSRILGFIRDVVIASYFGTRTAAQAFVVAFRIPNTLRHLIGEGAANSAVIPVLSEYLGKEDKEEFWKLSGVLLNILSIILFFITIAGILLAPLIVRIIAFGFSDDPAKLALTIKLTRIMFSFIFFIGLTAYAMGVLNTLKHFAVSAAGSCLLNITMIAFGLYFCRYFAQPIVGMAYAVLIGGFLQLLVQIPVLIKKGFRLRFPLSFRHPEVSRIGSLLFPRMLGSSIYQLNIFADTMFGSLGRIVGEGAIAALYYANRLIQFPTAIFGIAITTATLPTLSELAVNGETQKLKDTLMLSVKAMVFLLIPSSVGLFVLSGPIIRVLFEHGQFDAGSTYITTIALMAYCFGLFAYSGARLITSCFYALKDTRTPVKVTFICLIINVVLNFALMWKLKVAGIALATSISSFANFLMLVYVLKKRLGTLGFRKVKDTFVSVSLASIVMGLVCWYVYNYSLRSLSCTLSLAASILSGVCMFSLICWRLGLFGILKRIKFSR